MGCRFCEIRGTLCTLNNHVYFLLTNEEASYDPNNLPYRQHNVYMKIFKLLANTKNPKEKKNLIKISEYYNLAKTFEKYNRSRRTHVSTL